MAACVCLFALDKHEAIPVDTHVWQVATRYYTPHLKGKALNKQARSTFQAHQIPSPLAAQSIEVLPHIVDASSCCVIKPMDHEYAMCGPAHVGSCICCARAAAQDSGVLMAWSQSLTLTAP